MKYRSTIGKSLFALTLLLSLGGFARTLEVTSCTNGVASLALGEADGKAYRVMVGRGSLDAGSNLAAWETFEEIGTAAADATSFTYAFPESEHRFARFFLVETVQPIVKRLAYIQSGGSQYIDTGVRARTPVRAVLDMATVGVSEDKTILGARKNTGDTRFFLAHRYKTSDGYAYVVQAVNAWGTYLGKKVRDQNRYQHFESYIGTPARTLVVRDGDGTVSQSAVSDSIDTGLNLYLFAANMYGSAGQFANVRIYGCKIWLDDVLQRDFYPAEDSSGAAGLYDAVSHTFFTNQGSGTFTKGPEVAVEPRIFPVAVASDVVTIRNEGGAGEAPSTRDGLTGEWTFPVMNALRSAKGRDLELCNLTYDGVSAEMGLNDGVVLGDGAVRLPTYHGYRCYHGLPLNASYSVVMDVRVPLDADLGKLRAVFQPSPYHNTDSCFFLRANAGQAALDAWVASGTWKAAGINVDTWARCVLTYAHGGNKTLYINGQKIDARKLDRMKVTGDSFYFGLDNNTWGGTIEDYAIDLGYAAIYDRVLTDAEVSELHSRPTAHTGARDVAVLDPDNYEPAENAAPVAAIAPPATDVFSVLEPVPFTTSFTDEDGDWAMLEIDCGDGTVEHSTAFVMPGQEVVFNHLYQRVGTYVPRVRAVSQDGQAGAWTNGAPITLKFAIMNVDNLLLTRPWQQNVYTNRFTIMVEMNSEIAGLQLQYGEDYAQTVAMTGVCASAGNTWIYKGRVTLNGHPGETIPYRIGQMGLPFNGTRAPELEGMVKLWPMDDNESFSCSVWGDNQQGARSGDWDVDPYLYVTRLFEHMMARDVDFGLCTGDMASSANYATQIKPLVLDRTDVIFGSTKPYYVAWGNHDTSYSNNKPYFETPAIDEPNYRSSENGNSYLYRGNVLFILLDDSVCTTSATKTWLANLLATSRARAAKFRIVLHHVPIYTEVSGSMQRTLEQTFIDGGVDLVLGGHMHGYERLFFSGVTYVVNGCAGYLDHPLSVVHNWGDASAVGGHRDVPFLWARQSVADRNVLGAAEPVRMGMLMGYGELEFKGNELIYRAFGFNADGSYIGVFDAFRLTSKTVAASTTPAGNAPVCADPASFAEFTSKPVTNAKWKEYADAVGLAFTYPEGAANAPVTDVSKMEIEAFLAWLNGSTGTYRLPTAEELAAAFDGNFAREISEWTSTVDAARGRCRILGGPACAVPGTWARPTDRPEMLSADCSATYLGFRLATGPAPSEPDTLAAAAEAALALGSGDTGAYKWENGRLVSIADVWFATHSSALTFDVPVVLTGTGTLEYNSSKALMLNGGLVMPRATGFTKRGTGALTIRGSVRVGPTVGSSAAELEGFVFTSNGTLTLGDVTFTGTAASFRTANKTLYLAGTNDFSSAALAFNASSVTSLSRASGACAASLAARSMRQYAENASAVYGIGAGVTVTCAEDVKVAQALYVIDGKLDAGAVNATGNNGPYFQGAGTLVLGYLGSFQNSWTRWELANVVFTTGRPIRNNKASSRNRHQVEGASTRFAATCDWSILPRDELNMPVEWGSDLLRTESPMLVFDTLDPLDGTTAHMFEFLPNLASGAWGFKKVNPGTLVLKGTYSNTGAIRVEGGALRLAGETTLAASEVSVGTTGLLEVAGTSTVAKVVLDGGMLALEQDLLVRELTVFTPAVDSVPGTGMVRISDTFTPKGGYIANFELQDGATLNLSGKTSTWPIEGTGAHATTLAFADNATITIDVTGRNFTTDEKIVSWTSAPENLSTLKFIFEPELKYMSEPRIADDGIWVRPFKQLIIFR